MPKSFQKVVYKVCRGCWCQGVQTSKSTDMLLSPLFVAHQPDNNSSDLYQVIVNGPEYKKWKDGDKCVRRVCLRAFPSISCVS